MSLFLYVEDTYSQAIWKLAKQGGKNVKIPIRLSLGDMPKIEKHVENAMKSGATCILFVLDQENDHDLPRQALIRQIKTNFLAFCEKRANKFKDIKVGLVIIQRCLESWIATDLWSIQRYALNKKDALCDGNRFQKTTDKETGVIQKFISDLIDKSRNNRQRDARQREQQKKRGKGVSEKSRLEDIVDYMDLSEAIKYNDSLDYFLEVVKCDCDGKCHPLQQWVLDI